MRKIISLSLGATAVALAGCGSSAPTATPADVTVCHQFESVMGNQPAAHTWTWLDSMYQSDSAPDAQLGDDMTAWLTLMAAGGWAPGSGEQNQTAQAAVSIQQYCASIHAG